MIVLHLCVECLLCSPFDLDHREADVIILHLCMERLLCSPLGAVKFLHLGATAQMQGVVARIIGR